MWDEKTLSVINKKLKIFDCKVLWSVFNIYLPDPSQGHGKLVAFTVVVGKN